MFMFFGLLVSKDLQSFGSRFYLLWAYLHDGYSRNTSCIQH